jgi:hypothetical protein
MTTFVLRAPEHAHKLIAFLKENAGEQARIGQPLVVSVEAYAAKRSGEQNRLYWSVLTEIAEAVEIEGKRFSKEAWHEHFRSEFLPKQESPSGLVAVSTSQMTKQQFTDYVTRVQAYAANHFGVEFA